MAGIRHQLPQHLVESITEEPLVRQVRVSEPGGQTGPRNFVMKVSEPL